MVNLKDLGLKYKTDKATYHNYVEIYEKFFKDIRTTSVNLLEIGVWQGASIKMWLDYFINENSCFYGIDSIEAYQSTDKRFNFVKSKQEEKLSAEKFEDNFFDIIIDDGGHKMSEQQTSLKHFWKKLKPGGIYFIEDLQTSFNENWIDIRPTTYEVLKNKSESHYPELQLIIEEFQEVEIFNRDNTFRIESSILGVVKKSECNK